jgi:hypothetical protein
MREDCTASPSVSTRFFAIPSLEEARAIVRRGMQRRQAALLEKLESAVFGNARSPYLALFRNAGCRWEDARETVLKDGVEGALERFIEAGIYVTFEEFKGRTLAPIISLTLALQSSASPTVVTGCCASGKPMNR